MKKEIKMKKAEESCRTGYPARSGCFQPEEIRSAFVGRMQPSDSVCTITVCTAIRWNPDYALLSLRTSLDFLLAAVFL